MKKFIYIIVASIVFIGCNESYPIINMEEEEVKIIYPENSESGRVPIVPVLTDPQFELITRGVGPFGPWETDKEKWLNAEFHTYALLGSNRFSDADAEGAVNYRTPDETHRLLWNQKMKIVGNDLNVKFYDNSNNEEVRYYSWSHQNWKYNFFTFYADDLDVIVEDKNISSKEIKGSLEIDGSQDIMHAVAYHTKEQFDKGVKNLTDDEDKPLHEYGNELLYSTMSGHRGLQPIFNINHLLSRLDFMVKGAVPSNISTTSAGADSYQKIVIRKVTVTVPNKGTLTIAKDDWADSTVYKADLASNNVITWSGAPKPLYVNMKSQLVTDSYPWIINDEKYKENPYASDDVHFHITDTKVAVLGEPIMLPPSDMYRVTLYTDMLDLSAGANHEEGFLLNKIKSLDPIVYNITYRKDEPFKAGHAYTVIISVYGVQNIEGRLTLNAWIGRDAGDFVGKKEGEYDPKGDHVISISDDDD